MLTMTDDEAKFHDMVLAMVNRMGLDANEICGDRAPSVMVSGLVYCAAFYVASGSASNPHEAWLKTCELAWENALGVIAEKAKGNLDG